MMTLAQTKCIDPAHEVAAWPKDAGDLEAGRIEVFISHSWQCEAAPLPSALVAEFQLVEHHAVLWVEKRQWRVCLWQQAQQRERIAALCDVHYDRVIEHDASPAPAPLYRAGGVFADVIRACRSGAAGDDGQLTSARGF